MSVTRLGEHDSLARQKFNGLHSGSVTSANRCMDILVRDPVYIERAMLIAL